MKWETKKHIKTHIEFLNTPPIPRTISGLRKDGKPDKRVKHSMIQMQKYMEEASGISEAAKALGKLGGTATQIKLGNEHFKRISKLGVKARNEKLV